MEWKREREYIGIIFTISQQWMWLCANLMLKLNISNWNHKINIDHTGEWEKKKNMCIYQSLWYGYGMI